MIDLEKFERHIWRSLEGNLGERFKRVNVYAMAYWSPSFDNLNKSVIFSRLLPSNSVSVDYLEKGMDQNVLSWFNFSEIERKIRELSERIKLTRSSKVFLWQATGSIPRRDRDLNLEDSYYDLSFVYLYSPLAVALIVNVWWVWVPRKYEVIFFQEFVKPRSSEQIYRAKRGNEEKAILECRDFRRIYNDLPRLRAGALRWKYGLLSKMRRDSAGNFQVSPSVTYDRWCCFGEKTWKGFGLLSFSEKKLDANKMPDDAYFMLIGEGSIISEIISKISSSQPFKEVEERNRVLKRLEELEGELVFDLGVEGGGNENRRG